jgi:hypothetical protein
MATPLPTVTIRNPANPEERMRINASRYDPQLHELWDDEPPKKPASEPAAIGTVEDTVSETFTEPAEGAASADTTATAATKPVKSRKGGKP